MKVTEDDFGGCLVPYIHILITLLYAADSRPGAFTQCGLWSVVRFKLFCVETN